MSEANTLDVSRAWTKADEEAVGGGGGLANLHAVFLPRGPEGRGAARYVANS